MATVHICFTVYHFNFRLVHTITFTVFFNTSPLLMAALTVRHLFVTRTEPIQDLSLDAPCLRIHRVQFNGKDTKILITGQL